MNRNRTKVVQILERRGEIILRIPIQLFAFIMIMLEDKKCYLRCLIWCWLIRKECIAHFFGNYFAHQMHLNSNVYYTIQMFKRLIIGLLFFVAVLSSTEPTILVNSSHTHNTFQLILSLAPNTLLGFYSKKIVKSADHWTEINTETSPATINPAFPSELLLINSVQDGRSIIQYYESTISNDLNRHFHYIAVKHQATSFGYLLPSFSEKVPGFRTDRIYRCSQTIISVDWINGDAHIVVFSQADKWRIAQNIDGGFRSDERGVYYGYAIDYGHVHPVKLHVGDHQYCEISQEMPAAQIQFNFQVRENYELNDILYLAGKSLPVHNDRLKPEEL